MNKQVVFYATEEDKLFIAEILISVFGELIDVPRYYKEKISLFDGKKDTRRFYLTEKNRQKEISYYTFEYYDKSTNEILDYHKSPVLEYTVAYRNEEENYYISGRFYCCSENKEFSNKVSKFFTKFKKNFRYIKRYQVYISPSIDLMTAKFESITITTEDLCNMKNR